MAGTPAARRGWGCVNICVSDILTCVVWKWHNASYAPGQPRKLGVSAWHERNEKEVFLTLA